MDEEKCQVLDITGRQSHTTCTINILSKKYISYKLIGLLYLRPLNDLYTNTFHLKYIKSIPELNTIYNIAGEVPGHDKSRPPVIAVPPTLLS